MPYSVCSKILCDDSSGCGEVDADTMIGFYMSMAWTRINFEYLQLTGYFTKLPCLNLKILFSMSLYLYYSTIYIRIC